MEKTGAKGFSLGKTLVFTGLLLLFSAAGLYFYNQWIDYQAGQMSEKAVTALIEKIRNNQLTIVEVPDKLPEQKNEERAGEETGELKTAELDGMYYIGVLTVPAMDKILPIQSDWSEERLKRTPCRYSGSVEGGELVIAGHNYRKHFSGLAGLTKGDSIIFDDLEGNRIFYEVQEIYTVEATDIENMVHSGYDLSLFTCNYGGKARVTVRCTKCKQ